MAPPPARAPAFGSVAVPPRRGQIDTCTEDAGGRGIGVHRREVLCMEMVVF